MSKTSIYELAVLYHCDVEEAFEAAETKIKDLLTQNKAKILKENSWGKRDLAYPIKKQTQALYVFYDLELEGHCLAKIESSLNINEDIIRYLFHKIDLKALDQAINHPIDLIPAEEESQDLEKQEAVSDESGS